MDEDEVIDALLVINQIAATDERCEWGDCSAPATIEMNRPTIGRRKSCSIHVSAWRVRARLLSMV